MSEEREMTVHQACVLLKCRNVWRWGIVNIARRQSVAEHAYLVTVIGLALYDQCMKQHSLLERSSFAAFLMKHDAEEAMIGDIPATVKRAIEMRSPGILTSVKRDMGAYEAKSHAFDRTPLYALAKIADHVEAYKFASENAAPQAVIDHVNETLVNAVTKGMSDYAGAVEWTRLQAVVEELIAAE